MFSISNGALRTIKQFLIKLCNKLYYCMSRDTTLILRWQCEMICVFLLNNVRFYFPKLSRETIPLVDARGCVFFSGKNPKYSERLRSKRSASIGWRGAYKANFS